MLEKVDFPLTTSQISEFILDKGYTTYFKLQEPLSEMVESGLLRVETTHNRTLYHLTENGAETIQFFKNKISTAIQNDIDEFLKEKKYDLKEEVAIKSDYYLNTNHEYEVRCQIVENGFSLIDLKITVPTEIEAETIASNWSRESQKIYSSLLSQLLYIFTYGFFVAKDARFIESGVFYFVRKVLLLYVMPRIIVCVFVPYSMPQLL